MFDQMRLYHVMLPQIDVSRTEPIHSHFKARSSPDWLAEILVFASLSAKCSNKSSLKWGRRFKWDVFPVVSFWKDPRHPASKRISKGTGHKTIFIPFMALKRMHIMNLANKTTVFQERNYEAPLVYNIYKFTMHASILLILPYSW